MPAMHVPCLFRLQQGIIHIDSSIKAASWQMAEQLCGRLEADFQEHVDVLSRVYAWRVIQSLVDEVSIAFFESFSVDCKKLLTRSGEFRSLSEDNAVVRCIRNNLQAWQNRSKHALDDGRIEPALKIVPTYPVEASSGVVEHRDWYEVLRGHIASLAECVLSDTIAFNKEFAKMLNLLDSFRNFVFCLNREAGKNIQKLLQESGVTLNQPDGV